MTGNKIYNSNMPVSKKSSKKIHFIDKNSKNLSTKQKIKNKNIHYFIHNLKVRDNICLSTSIEENKKL